MIPWITPEELFYNRGPYHIETSPLIDKPNQCTGFYMIGASVMTKLRKYTFTYSHKCRMRVKYKVPQTIMHQSIVDPLMSL